MGGKFACERNGGKANSGTGARGQGTGRNGALTADYCRNPGAIPAGMEASMRPARYVLFLLAAVAANACARHPFYGAPKNRAAPQADRSQRPESPLPAMRPHTVVPSLPHPDNQPRSPDAHVPKRQFGGRGA